MTRTISSTVACTIGKVIAPTSRTATPSAKMSTESSAHAAARGQRLIHRVGPERLDADDAHGRPQRLDVAADAGNQPAAADRHEDRRDVAQAMPQDLVADGALARDDQRVVERMHERHAPLGGRARRHRACASA